MVHRRKTELQKNLVVVINWKAPEIPTTDESTIEFIKPVNIDSNLIKEAKKKNLDKASELLKNCSVKGQVKVPKKTQSFQTGHMKLH